MSHSHCPLRFWDRFSPDVLVGPLPRHEPFFLPRSPAVKIELQRLMSDPTLSQELRRALAEHSFGILSYEVMDLPVEHAVIVLPENITLLVTVSIEGWQVRFAPF